MPVVVAGAGDTNIYGGIIQLYWEGILGRCMDMNEEVRQSALKIVKVVLRQGIVHPITCVPYLIALETEAQEMNSKLAHHFLLSMNAKEDFCKTFKENNPNNKFVPVGYRSASASEAYCTEILASLPFTTPDEPLYLIYTINCVLQVRYGSLEATMKALSSHSIQEVKYAISDENGANCQAAIALQLLLKLKRHLKIAFGLCDARCQKFSPNDPLKPGEALSRKSNHFDISGTYFSLPTSHKEIIERYQVSALSRCYPTSASASEETTTGLTLNSVTWDDSDDKHDNNESNPQVVDNGPYCAYPTIFNYGNNNSDPFKLKNSDENQSNQEQNEFEEFEDPYLEDLNAQTLAKCMKLSKLSKVLKNQVNTFSCKLQGKTESTTHEIEVLENEKQSLHDKLVFLEKEITDAKEKLKSTLDELHSAKLDAVLCQQKLKNFCHGAKIIDKILCMEKTDSDKRGLGYKESLPNAKTPQITNFVKATASTSMPKHNMISTIHNYPKWVTYSQIYYCSICGQKGHIASYSRFIGPYQPYARPVNGYRYISNVISNNVKFENMF
ncbi:hypothetical protein GIB67_002316 [Kingdonia uniflora]|uniref:Sister chromatid cohesion protein n=1 Tax=Kingdonia uniflora TaxID=39325 RepID=A0A7J7KX03_9MAGN|nr:hypothetical protein GIB67_002316 [Kingdonia uniflora]